MTKPMSQRLIKDRFPNKIDTCHIKNISQRELSYMYVYIYIYLTNYIHVYVYIFQTYVYLTKTRKEFLLPLSLTPRLVIFHTSFNLLFSFPITIHLRNQTQIIKSVYSEPQKYQMKNNIKRYLNFYKTYEIKLLIYIDIPILL